MYSKQFPGIIGAILQFANLKNEYRTLVESINEQLLRIVLHIMKNKNDF